MIRLNLNTRINLFVIGLLFLIVTILGVYVYQKLQNQILQQVQNEYNMQLKALINTLDIQNNASSEKLKSGFKGIDILIQQNFNFEKSNDTTYFETVELLTFIQRTIPVQLYEVNNVPLNTDNSLNEMISEFTMCRTGIFQEVNNGYLLLSSNLTLFSQRDMTGTIYPKSYPALKKLKEKDTHIEYEYINGKWYISAYKSMNKFFNGAVVLRDENKALLKLEKAINAKQFSSAGLFVIDSTGILLMHPEGKIEVDISENNFFTLLKQKNQTSFRYKNLFQENEEKNWQYFFYTYYEPYNAYIGLNLPSDKLFESTQALKRPLIISILISLIVLSLGVFMILRPVIASIREVVDKISQMAHGVTVSKLNVERNDEIGEIVISLNSLIDTINNATIFAKEIEQGNLQAGFKPNSNDDELGNSLLNMRKSLLKAKEEEDSRKAEDEKRNWSTNGIAKFADILRGKNHLALEQFSQEIIVELVNYMQVVQGGLFIINDNDSENPVIEMMSCFAYNRKKIASKKFKKGEGLIGRCIDEMETLYMNEIPADYLTITSGLGGEKPKYLLIIPLKVNEEVFGAIEMASFKPVDDFKIEFAEKVCENIASALSTAKINQKTQELLEQSNEQAEEMAAQEEEMRQTLEEMMATQEEAERKENLARIFVNTVNHTMIRADFDTNGNLLYANSRFLDLFGYKSKEVQNISVSTFFLSQQSDDFIHVFDKIAEGGKHFEGEIEFAKKNGESIWLMATFTAMRTDEGNVAKVIFLGINIHDYKTEILRNKLFNQNTIENCKNEIETMYNNWMLHLLTMEKQLSFAKKQNKL